MRKLAALVCVAVALRAPIQAQERRHPAPDGREQLAKERKIGNLEVVATFPGPMPTGVTVSRSGRIFVNFPRWGDAVEFTVAEVKDGKAVAYPNAEINRETAPLEDHFVSVQSVVVDAQDRLWVLDTGAPKMGPIAPGGPKLVAIDLATGQIVKKIVFGPTVALKNSYLNDVRFDLRRSKEGTAFITDSSAQGPNAIIVVDLASGKAWRRLNNHASVRPDPDFVPVVEGERLMVRGPKGPPKPFAVGADGIALSADGKTVYYSPLSSRHLYRVSADALSDTSRIEEDVEGAVRDLGEKGASDGMESDAQGRLYAGDYEHNAIYRRNQDGTWTTLAHDPRILWPDTLSVASDGYLYFTANQLHRQAQFHAGQDLRQKPYVLFRLKIDGTPVGSK